VLFKQTIDLSVKRRALKPIEPASPEWSESGFIAATATFYDEEAHDLLESPVILFQAGLYADFGSLMRALGIAVDSFWGSAEWRAGVDLVPISRLPTPLESKDRHFPDTGQIISDDLIWAYFRSHGRAATLGSPMGATLQYFGRPTQYFGRHALRIAESGKVICWQPHLKDLL